jgi:cellulose synthase/poly-beta-1,6-N-acetylglucosamine synthase-like glycosyltransferase
MAFTAKAESLSEDETDSTFGVGDLEEAEDVGDRENVVASEPPSRSTSAAARANDALAQVSFPPTTAERKKHYFSMYMTCLALLVIAAVLFRTIYTVLYIGYLQDGAIWRLVIVACLPMIAVMMLFSTYFVVIALNNIFGPVAHVCHNSLYYSAIPTSPPEDRRQWPVFTIQLPVYTESLRETLVPTIRSLDKAVRFYRKMGGKAYIFVNDDGLQVLDDTQRAERIAFYEKHGIGYVARPPHTIKKRRGLFKKASNMNYSMNVALRVQEVMQRELENGRSLEPRDALFQVWNSEYYKKEFLAGGDVRMGDLILLVDADTRVPCDCLYKTVGEFVESENLGYTQHYTFPFTSGKNYWDRAISHFTKTMYFAMMFYTSFGDTAPLVGHNAILRWAAVQKAAKKDTVEEGSLLFWAVDRVSEDFDLAFRLQTAGYIGRYVTYTGAGFMEGVSISVHDEISRLKKYAFGACEMVFNTLPRWFTHGGPFTKHFREWLFSRYVPWYAKVNVIGYLFTYFAMACGVAFLCVNLGLWIFIPSTREELVSALDVQLTVLIIFFLLGVVGLAIVRWRINYDNYATRGMLAAFYEEFRHIPVLGIFWVGVPFHLSIVCFSYFLGLRVKFTASAKEKDLQNNVCAYLVTTVARYRTMYFFMFLFTIAFGVLLYAQPVLLQNVYITVPTVIFILGHVVGPYVLDPDIMRWVY